jgi:hypothetical protein
VGCFPHPQDTPHSQRQRDSETERQRDLFSEFLSVQVQLDSISIPHFLVSLFPLPFAKWDAAFAMKSYFCVRSAWEGGRGKLPKTREGHCLFPFSSHCFLILSLCPHAHNVFAATIITTWPHRTALLQTLTLLHTHPLSHSLTVHF